MPEHCGFAWIDDLGMGYCPEPTPAGFYGQGYWDEYVSRANSAMGREITARRCALVDKYVRPLEQVLDVGIGCGQFIETRGLGTFGHDVNPVGVEWLRQRGLYFDPRDGFAHMTFWDSIEHIADASRVLTACHGYAFITLPVFESEAEVVASKHFKPGEHLWYFSERGLIRWARGLGFHCCEVNRMESDAGREGIGTFVFRNLDYRRQGRAVAHFTEIPGASRR